MWSIDVSLLGTHLNPGNEPLLVAQFTDDNSDGAIDTSDLPDLVLTTIDEFSSARLVYVVDAVNPALVHWTSQNVDHRSGMLVADIDLDGAPNLVYQTASGAVQALDENGAVTWTTSFTLGSVEQNILAVADVDDDGDLAAGVERGLVEVHRHGVDLGPGPEVELGEQGDRCIRRARVGLHRDVEQRLGGVAAPLGALDHQRRWGSFGIGLGELGGERPPVEDTVEVAVPPRVGRKPHDGLAASHGHHDPGQRDRRCHPVHVRKAPTDHLSVATSSSSGSSSPQGSVTNATGSSVRQVSSPAA